MTTVAMSGGQSLRPKMGRKVRETLSRQHMVRRVKTLKRGIVTREMTGSG